MKNFAILFCFCLLCFTSKGQDSIIGNGHSWAGIYNQSDFYRHHSSQLVGFQGWTTDTSQRFYIEARYGYEAIYTGSLYIGFNIMEIKGIHCHNVVLTFMGGGVSGQVNGFSTAIKFEIRVTNFYLETENEYVCSSENAQRPSFLYNWSKIAFPFSGQNQNNYAVGLGVQFQGATKTMSDHLWYMGPMVRAKLSKALALDLFDYYDILHNSWVYMFA
ncbi:MAG TPA: hypothetical protein VNZ45_06640, partial [Bacteroidia bacterium]|nr:hypothetical protein [Bacteroidia bacterium]